MCEMREIFTQTDANGDDLIKIKSTVRARNETSPNNSIPKSYGTYLPQLILPVGRKNSQCKVQMNRISVHKKRLVYLRTVQFVE